MFFSYSYCILLLLWTVRRHPSSTEFVSFWTDIWVSLIKWTIDSWHAAASKEAKRLKKKDSEDQKWPEMRCQRSFHTEKQFHELQDPNLQEWKPSMKEKKQSTKNIKVWKPRLFTNSAIFVWRQNVHTALQLFAIRLAVFLKVFSR